ncbi:MAG: hypothetical protein F6J90_40555 [Moorea sp. SIOASIH]|uniref:hypothetical protein n=1 Tax=Moorena sp. SIOASIH TaxID=2607817 RepID=UPI0013BAE0F8|nr:hypothetical protein [Moorena sp. SIOASIH]NEO42280.1 hypothetical protein [Moorena sp. SIOASIH]
MPYALNSRIIISIDLYLLSYSTIASTKFRNYLKYFFSRRLKPPSRFHPRSKDAGFSASSILYKFYSLLPTPYSLLPAPFAI